MKEAGQNGDILSDSVYRRCTEKTNAEQQRDGDFLEAGGEGNGEFGGGMRTFWNER